MNLRPIVCCVSFLAVLPAAQAVEPAAVAALEELGRINGLTLATASRAWAAAPATRSQPAPLSCVDYGEIFEKATQDAYLAQGQGAACPDGKTLSQSLDQAESALRAAFPVSREAPRAALGLLLAFGCGLSATAQTGHRSGSAAPEEIVPRYLLQDPNGRAVGH